MSRFLIISGNVKIPIASRVAMDTSISQKLTFLETLIYTIQFAYLLRLGHLYISRYIILTL